MCFKDLIWPIAPILAFTLPPTIPSSRKGYLSEAVPIQLVGIGGPGAPRVFEMRRRCELSASAFNFLQVCKICKAIIGAKFNLRGPGED